MDLTARDNVLINAIMLGLTRKQTRERFDQIIAFAELEDFLDLKLKNYSSGMMVRLAFAVAIQIDAEILLIDEVLAVGDLAFRARSTERIGELVSGGAAVVLVSHAPEAIEALAHRVLWLDRGRVVACGRPTAVLDAYRRCSLSGRDEVEALR